MKQRIKEKVDGEKEWDRGKTYRDNGWEFSKIHGKKKQSIDSKNPIKQNKQIHQNKQNNQACQNKTVENNNFFSILKEAREINKGHLQR